MCKSQLIPYSVCSIFSDVPTSLEAWAKSRKVVIYSTGSIESQQLLFSHTAEGDVSPHITRYFDQSIGDKTESESYEKIAKELEVKTEEIIFVTDSSKGESLVLLLW